MSAIIELITYWDAYYSKYPNATNVEFCKYFIEQDKKKNAKLLLEKSNEELNSGLAELIGKMSNFHTVYSKMVLKEMPDVEIEWFYILNVIKIKKDAKKSEIISLCLLEQSTGIDILNRMKKKGLIVENHDPNDKRAKRISITKSGGDLLFGIGKSLYKVTYLFYEHISREDLQNMINILFPIVAKHSKLMIENKGKGVDELLQALYGEDALDELSVSFNKHVKKHQQILTDGYDDEIKSYHK